MVEYIYYAPSSIFITTESKKIAEIKRHQFGNAEFNDKFCSRNTDLADATNTRVYQLPREVGIKKISLPELRLKLFLAGSSMQLRPS